jgi:hypothetical protein
MLPAKYSVNKVDSPMGPSRTRMNMSLSGDIFSQAA